MGRGSGPRGSAATRPRPPSSFASGSLSRLGPPPPPAAPLAAGPWGDCRRRADAEEDEEFRGAAAPTPSSVPVRLPQQFQGPSFCSSTSSGSAVVSRDVVRRRSASAGRLEESAAVHRRAPPPPGRRGGGREGGIITLSDRIPTTRVPTLRLTRARPRAAARPRPVDPRRNRGGACSAE